MDKPKKMRMYRATYYLYFQAEGDDEAEIWAQENTPYAEFDDVEVVDDEEDWRNIQLLGNPAKFDEVEEVDNDDDDTSDPLPLARPSDGREGNCDNGEGAGAHRDDCKAHMGQPIARGCAG